MKYLCLVYQEEKQEANVGPEVLAQAKKDFWAFTEDIKKSGPLQKPKNSSAATSSSRRQT